MNSKQLNFFVLPEELDDMQRFFIDKNCVFIENNIVSIDTAISDNMHFKQNTFQVFLSDERFISNIYFNYLESKNYFYLDVLRSYAIEFSFGGFQEEQRCLERSRLYYVSKYYDQTSKVTKSDEFINWSNDLIKKFERSFLKSYKQIEQKLSPKATTWYNNNNAIVNEAGNLLHADVLNS